MREEEQLAHDVHVTPADEWDPPVFTRTAVSERRHVDRFAAQLDRSGIEDPMVGRPPGTSTIPAMQQSFDELVAEGRRSPVGALEVGASIEEMDIVDLHSRSGDVADTQRLDTRLEQGSHRHLRAFVRQLDAFGVGYGLSRLDVVADATVMSDG